MNNNDKIKFEEFLKILPRKRVAEFFEYTEGCIYPVELFTDYENFNEGFLISFESEKVDNAFKKFDEAFFNLKNYLLRISQRTGIKEPEKKLFGSFEQGSRELWELEDILKKEYINFVKISKQEIFKNPSNHTSDYKPKKIKLFRGDFKPEIEIGKLSAYNDGSVRYNGNEIKMRNQIKDLCRLFMEKPNQLLTYDDIKDHIIHANRRGMITHTTISKYVSELHNSLNFHYKKRVVFNQKNEGWYFKP